MDARPNVIYVVCHDLGRRLGCYGFPINTPRLDAFAAEGMRLNRMFCTSVACSPSRACAMSGRYAHSSGGIGLAHMGFPLPLDVRTTVDDFNEAGYETILSGVNHERHPRTDRYQVDVTRTWADWGVERAVNNAVAHLERRDPGRPFYLNLGTQEPHGVTWGGFSKPPALRVTPEEVAVPHGFPDTPLVRREMARFQSATMHLDEHLGRLFDALDRLGLTENTLVLFTTDHGIGGPRAKGTLYDLGTEIALLARWPGRIRAGSVSDALLGNIDYRPTLREVAGLPPADEIQGRSFLAVLEGRTERTNDAIFTERNYHGEGRRDGTPGYANAFDPVRAIRTPRFHYIRWWKPEHRPRVVLPYEVPRDYDAGRETLDACSPPGPPRATEELYDVEHDPLEWVDLSERREYAAIKADLRARLQGWMEETDDFLLRGETPLPREPEGWGPNWPA